jgi:hypothetical protein
MFLHKLKFLSTQKFVYLDFKRCTLLQLEIHLTVETHKVLHILTTILFLYLPHTTLTKSSAK